ncbi:hypothetical protein Kisp02_06320 [Kineosporia sp. NBRC 101731]|nr:hypothetical protein Kisp02_06320 [Kineosporia sp. NBRC 101731]
MVQVQPAEGRAASGVVAKADAVAEAAIRPAAAKTTAIRVGTREKAKRMVIPREVLEASARPGIAYLNRVVRDFPGFCRSVTCRRVTEDI